MPAHSIYHALAADWPWQASPWSSSKVVTDLHEVPTSFVGGSHHHHRFEGVLNNDLQPHREPALPDPKAEPPGDAKRKARGPPCPRLTGQACHKDEDCTKGRERPAAHSGEGHHSGANAAKPEGVIEASGSAMTTECSSGQCSCKDGCFAGGLCVRNGCHVAVAQVAAIQAVGGITSPMAQSAALRAGRSIDERLMVEDPDAKLPPPERRATSGSEATGGLTDVDATVSLPTYTDGTPVVLSKGNNAGNPELQALMRKLLEVSKTLQGVASKEISNEVDLFAPTPAQRPAVAAGDASGAIGLPASAEVQGTSQAHALAGVQGSSVPGYCLLAACLAPSSFPIRWQHFHSEKSQWSAFFPRVALAA